MSDKYDEWSETERLAALHRTELLDTPPEQAFDDLVQAAASPVINRNGCLSTLYRADLPKLQIVTYSACSDFAARIGRAHAAVMVGIVVVIAARRVSTEPFLTNPSVI